MNINERHASSSDVKYEDDKYRHLIGLRFGKLTTIHAYHFKQGRCSRLIMVCKCDCGNVVHQRIEFLRKVKNHTCGCRQHKLSRTRLYYVWKNIKNRCLLKSCSKYKWYGARGITICDEWKDHPEEFIKWCLANGYKEGLQIDRRNNDKGYCPDNCRFITAKENQRNKYSNRMVTFRGETKTLVEWCEILNVSYSMICTRISNGMTPEKALLEPICKRQQRKRFKGIDGRLTGRILEHDGLRMTIPEWAEHKGIEVGTLYARLHKGWSVEKALEEKVAFRRKRKEK